MACFSSLNRNHRDFCAALPSTPACDARQRRPLATPASDARQRRPPTPRPGSKAMGDDRGWSLRPCEQPRHVTAVFTRPRNTALLPPCVLRRFGGALSSLCICCDRPEALLCPPTTHRAAPTPVPRERETRSPPPGTAKQQKSRHFAQRSFPFFRALLGRRRTARSEGEAMY